MPSCKASDAARTRVTDTASASQGELGVGKEAFVARAKELAAKYGDRFLPPASLES